MYILELLGPAGGIFWNSWDPRGVYFGTPGTRGGYILELLGPAGCIFWNSPQEAGLDPPKQKAMPHPDRTRVVLRLLLFRNIASDCVLHTLSVERSAAEMTILETPVLAHMHIKSTQSLPRIYSNTAVSKNAGGDTAACNIGSLAAHRFGSLPARAKKSATLPKSSRWARAGPSSRHKQPHAEPDNAGAKNRRASPPEIAQCP